MESQGALPACNGTNGPPRVNCKPAPPPRSLAQAPTTRPVALPIIDTSSLPVCNGTNGTPNVDCRPATLAQNLAQGEDGADKQFTYPGSNGFDLPELPECTGMNGPDAGGRKV